MINFGTVSPLGYLLLCAAAAGLLSWLLYRKTGFDSKRMVWLMAVLRFMGLLLVFLLLLSPFLKVKMHEELKPRLLFFQDKSLSADSLGSAKAFDEWRSLESELKEKYSIVHYDFAESTINAGDSLDKRSTNISEVLDRVNESAELYPNVTAVLLTDGIYNNGLNPLFRKLNRNTPLYTIGLGDTLRYPDLELVSVETNATAFLGNEFVISCNIKANGMSGRVGALEVLENGKLLRSESLKLDRDELFLSKDLFIKPASAGAKLYQVRVSCNIQERNMANNTSSASVFVTDTRRKIVLAWQAIHPDISAIYSSLEKFGQYEIVRMPFNLLKPDAKVDLYILHGFGANRQQQAFLQELVKLKKPFWIVAGSSSNPQFLRLPEVPLMLHFQQGMMSDVFPTVNSSFNAFSTESFAKQLLKWPPLKVPAGRIETRGNWLSLLNQKIGSVETDYPLFGFANVDGARYAYLFGEGIWRWRIADRLTDKDALAFNDLIIRTVQYLSAAQNKNGFKIYTRSHEFSPSETVVLFGEYTDQSGNLNNIDKATVNLEVKGQKRQLTMNKKQNIYSVDLGVLPSGNYTYTATHGSGALVEQVAGSFTVTDIERELRDLTADYTLMRSLSSANSGRFYKSSEMAALAQSLMNENAGKTIIKEKSEVVEWIKSKWVFALIVFFFTSEWFLRKWLGGY